MGERSTAAATLAVLVCAASLGGCSDMAEPIEGRVFSGDDFGGVVVIDGDTLDDSDGVRHRLHGIDAPESAQVCSRADGSEWRCGDAATARLAELVSNGAECVPAGSGADRYGRQISRCVNVFGADVGERLALEGLAWAYRRYSAYYVAAENAARGDSRGVWDGANVPAWEWRQ